MAFALVLALATLARAPWLARSLPYLGYTDEGHVLHHVAGLLRAGSWDPGWYGYPSLTLYLIAGAFRSYETVVRVAGGHTLAKAVSSGSDYYDFVTPPALILTGRVVVLVASLAVVLLGMAIARRVAGELAGFVAGIVLALCPALVQRSSIVIVDTVAAAFALGALAAALRLRPETGGHAPKSELSLNTWAALAGVLSGLGAAAKYPVGAVLLAVLGTIVLLDVPVRSRARLAALAAMGALLAAVVGMPALVLRSSAVLSAIREQAQFYANPSIMAPGAPPEPSLLQQAFKIYELGPVLPVVGLTGLVVLASQRRFWNVTIPWCLFGIALTLPVLSFPFQPFRNVLALVPLAVVFASVALDLAFKRGKGGVFAGLLVSLILVGSFAPGLALIARVRGARDTRVLVVDRLARDVGPADDVLVVRELAFLPAELARIGGRVTVVSWNQACSAATAHPWKAVVFGQPDPRGLSPPPGMDVGAEESKFVRCLGALQEEFRIGSWPTALNPSFWRSNDELLVVARTPPP